MLIVIFPVIILLSSVFAEKSSAAATCAEKGGYCINGSLGIECSSGFFNAGVGNFACFDSSTTCCLPNSTPTPTPTIAPTNTPTPVPPTPTPTNTSTCAGKGGFCVEGYYSCGGGYYSSNAPGCGLTKKCCLLNPTPTPTPIPQNLTQTPCQTAGGSCIPIGPCVPPSQATSLSCGGGVCCQVVSTNIPTPTTAPKNPALKWMLIASSCNVKATAKTTTSFCNNFTDLATCNDSNCTWQEVDVSENVNRGVCIASAPTLTPTNTPTPTSSPIVPTATPTPIPAIACTKNAGCKTPPECKTAEGSICVNADSPNPDAPRSCLYLPGPVGVPCKIGDKKGACNNGFCDLSAPVVAPTATPTEPTNTPTPIPPGKTFLKFNIALSEINPNPKRSLRNLTVEIFDPLNNNQKIEHSINESVVGINYDLTQKILKGGNALPDTDWVPKSGIYNIKVKSDGYLRKLILSVPITKGVQNDIALATLTPGDINGDNRIDILDYNLLRDCFGNKADTSACSAKANADINDDGVVDGIDYNAFIKSLSVKEGD